MADWKKNQKRKTKVNSVVGWQIGSEIPDSRYRWIVGLGAISAVRTASFPTLRRSPTFRLATAATPFFPPAARASPTTRLLPRRPPAPVSLS